MGTSGKCMIPPDVAKPTKRSPAEQASEDRNATLPSAGETLDADFEYAALDDSFLMTLLRALSAWST